MSRLVNYLPGVAILTTMVLAVLPWGAMFQALKRKIRRG